MTARTAEGSVSELIDAIKESRQCTIELVADLSDKQLMGPRLAIVNPLRWEIGHVGWFQEFWCLRYFVARLLCSARVTAYTIRPA